MPVDLKALTKFDTPTVCNTIELFAVRPRTAGYMDGRIRACFPEMGPIAGYALTATIRCALAPREGNVYSSISEQVERFGELDGPAIVVFQDLDDPPVAATFGEVMCTSYKAFGAVGIITSGAARDLDQVRQIGFPAFSDGAICSHGYSHVVSVHGAIRVGGIAVDPGDLLHADANGVTTIPPEIASEIPQAAAEFVAAESITLNYLRGGNLSTKGFADARRGMTDAIAELATRVRRGGSKR